MLSQTGGQSAEGAKLRKLTGKEKKKTHKAKTRKKGLKGSRIQFGHSFPSATKNAGFLHHFNPENVLKDGRSMHCNANVSIYLAFAVGNHCLTT